MSNQVDPASVQLLARLNHTEFLRELARWSGDTGAIEERDGVLLYACGTGFPVTLNGVVRLDPTAAPERVFDLADSWFGALGRGYTLSTRVGADAPDDLLEAAAVQRGLVLLGDSPVMVCRHTPRAVPPPAGIDLRWVDDGSSIADAVAVSDAAYQSLGMPAGIILEATTSLERMQAPHLHTVIAYEDDVPLATAMVLSSHGIAGVYYVGTVESARRRGLADAVTRAVTIRGLELGARFVCLQATAMGEPVYRRMGYEEIERYHGMVRLV